MSSERKLLARHVAELANELEALTRGRGPLGLLGDADRSHLQAAVAADYEAACERLRQCDDLPGQRNLFAAEAA